MSGSNYKVKKILQKFPKFNVLFLMIVVISLPLLFLPYSIQYDSIELLAAQAQLKPSINSSQSNNMLVKTTSAISISSVLADKYAPFTVNLTLPPRIVMVYNGTQHLGVLVSYKYRHGYTFGQLDIPLKKVTELLPSDVITIKKGSFVQFFAKGNPSILPANSMSIDAYASQGKALSVLNTTKATNSTFALNLNEGRYILLATATWIPGSEDVTGYAIFSYMVDVVP